VKKTSTKSSDVADAARRVAADIKKIELKVEVREELGETPENVGPRVVRAMRWLNRSETILDVCEEVEALWPRIGKHYGEVMPQWPLGLRVGAAVKDLLSTYVAEKFTVGKPQVWVHFADENTLAPEVHRWIEEVVRSN
jgi:hypothetical protein